MDINIKNVMLSMSRSFALLMLFVLGGGSLHAGDWQVVQTVTLQAVPSVNQGTLGLVNGGFQTLNEIYAGADNSIGVAGESTQTVDASAIDTLTLYQSTVNAATQAVNYAEAGTIGGNSSGLTQILIAPTPGSRTVPATATTPATTSSTLPSTTLIQTISGAGGSNLQAVNAAKAVTISKLTQTFAATGVALAQSGGGSGSNVQAINNAEATGTAGVSGLTQLFTYSYPTDLRQGGGFGLTSSGNTQALNRVVGKVTGNISQTVTSASRDTTITNPDGTTTAGTIKGSLALTQSTQENGQVQAANLIDIKGESVTLGTDVDGQTLNLDSVSMIQNGGQGTTNSLQALNAAISDNIFSDSSLKQSITLTGAVSMLQDNTAAAHQALNYVGIRPSSS